MRSRVYGKQDHKGYERACDSENTVENRRNCLEIFVLEEFIGCAGCHYQKQKPGNQQRTRKMRRFFLNARIYTDSLSCFQHQWAYFGGVVHHNSLGEGFSQDFRSKLLVTQRG